MDIQNWSCWRSQENGKVRSWPNHATASKTHASWRIESNTYSTDKHIEQHSTNIEWLGKSAQPEVRWLEMVGGHCKTKQWDQTIGSDGRDSSSRHEGCKCNLARQNGTQDHGTKDIDDCDRILGLPVGSHLTDPARQREDTITGDGEHEPGRCNNANTRILLRSDKSAATSFHN